MNTSNAEEKFNIEWQQYFDSIDWAKGSSFDFEAPNPKHKDYKSRFDDYTDRKFIYEELIKNKDKLNASNNGGAQPWQLVHWLCAGIERSLEIASTADDTKLLKENIEALESIEDAFDKAIKAVQTRTRLNGEIKLVRYGTPTTVTKELEYLKDVSLRPLSNLRTDYDYVNQYGQSGRQNAKLIRFGKSLALYFYETIGMRLNGTVAHITNAMFSLTDEAGNSINRDIVREWTKQTNWSNEDLEPSSGETPKKPLKIIKGLASSTTHNNNVRPSSK